MSHHAHAEEHHIIPYATYIQIWLVLCAFTSLTVVAASMNFGHVLNVVVALLIATTKATLVLMFFMHMKYDWALLKVMVWITIATIGVIVPLYLTDFLTR